MDLRPVHVWVVVEMDAIVVGIATLASAIALAQAGESPIRQFRFLSGQRDALQVFACDPDSTLDAFAADVLGNDLIELMTDESRFAQSGSETGVECRKRLHADLFGVCRGFAHGVGGDQTRWCLSPQPCTRYNPWSARGDGKGELRVIWRNYAEP